MKIKLLITIVIISLLSGCKGEQGEPGETKTVYVYGQQEDSQTYYPSGHAQDGPYLYGADVRFYRQDLGTPGNVGLFQTGAVFQTITDNDYGHYFFDGGVTGRFGEVFVDGYMFNEVSGLTSDRKTLSAIIDLSDTGPKNINPLTHMRTPIMRYLYNNDYINDATEDRIANSKNEAEARLLSFFNMPNLPGQNFEDLDLSGDTKGDAVLTAVNIMLLWDSTGDSERPVADQLQIMTQIAGSLKADPSGDAQLKIRLAQDGAGLANKIIQIRDNLEGHYHSLGEVSFTAPNFWNHLDFDLDGIRNDDDPDSNIDILVDTHEIKWHQNLTTSCNVYFDTTDNRFFALPFVFPSSISTTKYILSSLEGDYMSIYSVDDNGTVDTSDDTPGSPMAVFAGGATSVVSLPSNFFQDTYQDATGDYHSDLPGRFQANITGHTIPADTNIFIVMWKDSNYRPSGICSSGLVPFGRNQFSSDGVSWIGATPPQNAPLFRNPWLKIAGLD